MLGRFLRIASLLAFQSSACANRVTAEEETQKATIPAISSTTMPVATARALAVPRRADNPEVTTPRAAPAGRRSASVLERNAAVESSAVPSVAPSASEPAPTLVATRSGPVASDEAASLWFEGADWVPVGERAVLRAVIRAVPPYHCNQEYRHRVFLSNPVQNLEFPSTKATEVDVGGQDCAVKVPVVAKASGASTLRGEVQFSVCTESRCRIERREVTFDVVVR